MLYSTSVKRIILRKTKYKFYEIGILRDINDITFSNFRVVGLSWSIAQKCLILFEVSIKQSS